MESLKRMLMAVALVGILHPVQAADAPKQSANTAKKSADVAKPADKPLQLLKAATGTGVQDRELVGEAAEFNVSVGKVYCWSKIDAKELPATIKYVWYADGEKQAEVPFTAKNSPARSWSTKNVWPAKWKVEIVSDKGGAPLATLEFIVKG